MINYAEINARRADVDGWTRIVQVGSAPFSMLGTPPDGAPNSRGQAMIPDYCGDWRHVGRALASYTKSSVWTDEIFCYVVLRDLESHVAMREMIADHPSLDAAMRTAVIKAETMLLRARGQRTVAMLAERLAP